MWVFHVLCLCGLLWIFFTVALFNLPQYEVDYNACSSIGTTILETEFIVSSMSDGAIEYLEFNLTGDQGFLLNGTTSPLVVQPPFRLRYPLTISIGSGRDVNEVIETISLQLSAFVSTSSGAAALTSSVVMLHKLSE